METESNTVKTEEGLILSIIASPLWQMAEMNTPEHMQLTQIWHVIIHVTQSPYPAVSESGVDALQGNPGKL